MNNNPYSKYRFDNTRSVKVRADQQDNVVDVFGVAVRPQSDNITTKLFGVESTMYGVTTIENYVYKVERINIVDRSIMPPAYKGPTYFKPF